MNTKHKYLLAGLVIGILAPFAVDLLLFGTPMPCRTISPLEDGSSIQLCEPSDKQMSQEEIDLRLDPKYQLYEEYTSYTMYEDGSFVAQTPDGQEVVGCVNNGLCQD